ncbi:putative leucine-rich repeat-containing protein DDB_G0290503 [Ananas comosus]|uniref:Leucine-rich repeat-containing protein DDB_G0290503 n=1 Tax=Ananas comosus TaxID=4615 RepID=A0A6P5GE75_ANACO|nr:putative leucine-rich repeat-containing protein DDB_G0290503 [Ananas comosus]
MEGKWKGRGNAMNNSNNVNRRRPYALLLLLALGAAVLSVVILHKMRERRLFNLLLRERDDQLLSLQLLLQKEKATTKEMKEKLEVLQAKSTSVRTESAELNNKLMESESTSTYLKNIQKELEAALEEKENQINQLEEKAARSIDDRATALTDILKQKEAEIEEMKRRLSSLAASENLQEKTAIEKSTPVYPSNENTTLRDKPPENPISNSNGTTAKEGINVVNANKMENSDNEDISREGTWVMFKTNKDDEGFEDNTESDIHQNSADVSGNNNLEKHETPRENEKSPDGGKFGQQRELGDEEQMKRPKDEETQDGSQESQIPGAEDGKSGYDERNETEISKDRDLPKFENQYENKQEEASNDQQGMKIRSRHGKRAKKKHRQRRMIIDEEEEFEKHNDVSLKTSQGDEKQTVDSVTTDKSSKDAFEKEPEVNMTGNNPQRMYESEDKQESFSSSRKVEIPEGSVHDDIIKDEGDDQQSKNSLTLKTETYNNSAAST